MRLGSRTLRTVQARLGLAGLELQINFGCTRVCPVNAFICALGPGRRVCDVALLEAKVVLSLKFVNDIQTSHGERWLFIHASRPMSRHKHSA